MIHYKCKHFKLHEFVSQDVKTIYGLNAWQFLDPRLLYTADRIREHFGAPMTINNWHWKLKKSKSEEESQAILNSPGVFDQRGLRSPWCREGAILSQHRFGRALDFDIRGFSAEQVRQEILKEQNCEKFRYISVMEDCTNWVHVDIRQMTGDQIYLLPKK